MPYDQAKQTCKILVSIHKKNNPLLEAWFLLNLITIQMFYIKGLVYRILLYMDKYSNPNRA